MKKVKTAILVDALVNKGGFERIVLLQAISLNADIYVGRYNPKTTFEEFKKTKIIKITEYSNIGYTELFGRIFTLYLWFLFSRLNLNKKYDVYLIHGSGALNAARRHHPNIWYCHAPSRYLYDLYVEEFHRHTRLFKLLFPIITSFQRKIDQNNVKYINKILVNSNNVKKRVKKFYNRDSTIVYPFVDTTKFKWISQEDFYFSPGRLDRIKRTDLIIKAFLKMPNKKLIVASSGPDEKRFREMARNAKNIVFLGWISDKKMGELYGKCIATLYLSYKEDFGMVPLESMSAGKPCIATKEGGHKETIINKKTGLLITPKNIQEIIKAVNWVTPERAKQMRKECEKRARRYSLKEHMKRLRKLMDEAR